MTVLRLARALAEREWAGRMTYRFAWVFEAFGVVVYLAALFYISRLVPPEMIAGHDWFTLTAVGVGVLTFLGTLSSGPRGFVLGEIGYGTMEVLLVLGPPLRSFIAASILLQAFRALGRLAALFLAAALFGWSVPLAKVVTLLPVLALAAVVGGGMGLFQAALDLRVRRVGRVFALGGGLGSILSGVYFPVALLPAPLRMVAELLPATHAIRAGRALLLGGDWVLPLGVLAVLGLVLLPIGLAAFRMAMRSMREDGSFLTP